MDVAQLVAILGPLGIYALAVPMPGPSLVLISRASLRSGATHGSAAAFGTTAGVVVHAVATVFGLTTLMLALPWLMSTIQVVGGIYLLYLGLTLMRSALSRPTVAGPSLERGAGPGEPPMHLFHRGLLIGLSNPKMAAFFLGLFAPVMSEAMPLGSRLLVLGGIVLIDLIYHQTVAQVAAKGRGLTRSAGRWFDALTGSCMATFGLGLVVKTLSRRA